MGERSVPLQGKALHYFFTAWGIAAPFALFPHLLPVATALSASLLLVGLLVIRRRGCIPQTALDLPLLIYLGLSTVALLATPIPQENLRRLTALLLGVTAYYGIVAGLASRDGERVLASVVSALPLLGGVVACLGLLTVRAPMRYLIDLRALTAHLPRIGGDFSVSYNQLAGVLILFLLPGIFVWRRVRLRAVRYLAVAALALMSSTILLTQSRNGLLSLALGVMGGLLWQKGRFRLLFLFFVLLLLLPLLLGGLPAIQELLYLPLDRLDQATKVGPAPDQSWLARLEIWTAAIRLMGDYPVLGSGLYEFERASWANHGYRTLPPDFNFSHAHNLWLHTGAGLGWPGWMAAVLLWLAVLYHLVRATRAAPPDARWVGVALGATICGYLTFNTFDILAPEQSAGLFVWLLLALVAAYIHVYEPAPAKASGWWRIHLAPLLLLVILLPWLPRNLAHLQLDRARLVDAPRALPPLSDLAGGDYRRRGLWHALQGDERAAIAMWRKDPEALMFLKGQGLRTYFRKADPEAALDWYARALALEPTAASVYYWQGRAYEQLDRDPAALHSFRQAVDHGPGEMHFGRNLQALAWERQGRLFARQGEWQQAATAFGAALSLEPHIQDYRQQLEDVQRALSELETSRVESR